MRRMQRGLPRQMMQAIESMDTELIARQNEQLMKVVASLDKVSKIYLQNLLYSIIKAIYDKFQRLSLRKLLLWQKPCLGQKA